MSAWIEIANCLLKYSVSRVALYMSAWIEMLTLKEYRTTDVRVALYMSAWIEIVNGIDDVVKALSHST